MSPSQRLAALMVLVALLSAVPLLSWDSEADPTYLYGDADVVIEDTGSDNIVYTAVGGTDTWDIQTVPYGEDFSVAILSEIEGSLRVVMTGGDFGSLNLVSGDVSGGTDPVDLSFVMFGGSVDHLSVLEMEPEAAAGLSDSYILMYRPLDEVGVDIRGGTVLEFAPTSDMVSVASLKVSVDTGATVHRLLTTGYNGSYLDVEVSLRGGVVGYMANIKSVVANLSYNFESGSVDYFCIGADTEAGDNSTIAGMSTFYVQEGVRVVVDNTVSVGDAVLGAGVLDLPSVLWNGFAALGTVTKDIVVDAPWVPLFPDTCFFEDRSEGTVYTFDGYTVGSNPEVRQISSSYSNGSDESDVYGPDGIWNSATDLNVGFGFNLYVNSYLTIPAGSVLTVDSGGRMVISGNVILYGTIINNGGIVNNGLVERREGGTLTGVQPEGDGIVATTIRVNNSGEALEVYVPDSDAVILDLSRVQSLSSMSVQFKGNVFVTVQSPNTSGFGSSRILVSLSAMDPGEELSSYRLVLYSLGSDLRDDLDVSISIPKPVEEGQSFYVYLSSPDSVDPVSVDYSLEDPYRVVIGSAVTGTYVLSMDTPPDDSHWDEGTVNVLLAIVIVIVGMGLVLAILRKED